MLMDRNNIRRLSIISRLILPILSVVAVQSQPKLQQIFLILKFT